MFLSKCLVSKKGPLGAIWVAAYFHKKLNKSQIFDTNICSSVDNILQYQLDVLTYRVLAYLLIGVVRIYSKKVEYLFDDCQEVLVKINDFVVRERKRAKKEAVRACSSSITRPVCFDLDAFEMEILEDASGEHVVPREEITLKDVAWKSAGIGKYTLDRFAALDDDFLMDYIPTEGFSCHPLDFEIEGRTSLGASNSEASMEKLQLNKSFLEEVSHLKAVCGYEEEPPNLDKVIYQIHREHVEVSDMEMLENHIDREASREKYSDRFMSEEFVNLHGDAEDDSPGILKPVYVDHTNREKMKGLDQSQSDKEMHQAMEEDHVNMLNARAEVPDTGGSDNHINGESSRERCNHLFSIFHSEAKEERLSPFKLFEEPLPFGKPLGEEIQTNIVTLKDLDKSQSNNEMHRSMAEDHVNIQDARAEFPDIGGSDNLMEKEASRERCNYMFSLEEGVTLHSNAEEECLSHFMLPEELARVDKPLVEEIQTGAEKVNFPAMTTSEDQKSVVSSKDHPLSVMLDSTLQSKLQDASGDGTPHFMLIRTPATKEHARFSRKRKCLFDDMIVFPNDVVRQWIKDASDLVSNRRIRRAALAARKSCCFVNLPESFSEPSIPCTSELKTLWSKKRFKLLDSVKIMKTSEEIDALEPPAIDGSSKNAEITSDPVEIRNPPDKLNLSEYPLFDGSLELTGIAPQTPVRHTPPFIGGEKTEIAPQTPVLPLKSVRPYESPENVKCDNFDLVGYVNMDPSESIGKGPSPTEVVEEMPSLEKDEDLDLNLVNERMISSGKGPAPTEVIEEVLSLQKDEDLDLNMEMHSNEDASWGQGWSTRTRMVAKHLQTSFLVQRERGEEEKVNLSQLLERRTKKSSSRFFYEILVLKTKGLVDVQQDAAFGNIFVLKAPQWTNLQKM